MNAQMAALAHDMRAPLAAICALTELMRAHAGEETQVLRYAGQMDMACGQLLSLAEDMLGGERPLQPAPCTPRQIAAAAAEMAGAPVALRFEGECGIDVLADEKRVRRILLNLLGNAIKYSPGGPPPELCVEAVQEDGAYALTFSVTDRGLGMSRDTLARLFTPYARGAEAAAFPGTGLGLSASRELARRMGGDIAAQSRLGEGSRFTLTLCCPAVRAELLRGKRFLLAEDSDLAADALCELLEEAGAQAERAENGRQAVGLVLARPPRWYDAILMDAVMPEMDGFAAARAIRASGRAKGVPIVALTGASALETARKAQESGMNARAVKPVSMRALEALLAPLWHAQKNQQNAQFLY